MTMKLNTTSAIAMHLDGDACWPDLDSASVFVADTFELALLPGGMTSGQSSVTLRMNTVDGEGTVVVLYQVSLGNLETAVRACRAREEYLREIAANTKASA